MEETGEAHTPLNNRSRPFSSMGTSHPIEATLPPHTKGDWAPWGESSLLLWVVVHSSCIRGVKPNRHQKDSIKLSLLHPTVMKESFNSFSIILFLCQYFLQVGTFVCLMSLGPRFDFKGKKNFSQPLHTKDSVAAYWFYLYFFVFQQSSEANHESSSISSAVHKLVLIWYVLHCCDYDTFLL